MNIAVFGNTYQDSYAEELRRFFCDLLDHEGVSLLFEKSYFSYLSRIMPDFMPMILIDSDSDFSADLALSVGGDGTFLHTAASIAPRQIPIMGINTGHLGYLSASTLKLSPSLTEDIVNRNYIVEDRAMLKVETIPSIKDSSAKFTALNEIVVERADVATMLETTAFIDGRHLASYQGDGLIIATPTGSTAYNLSAGGPILAPNAPSWVLTPVAPHSLNMRPLVVSSETEIRLKTTSRNGRFTLSVDGHSISLPTDTELIISKAPYATRLVRTTGHTFIDTLRTKLLWGMSPR